MKKIYFFSIEKGFKGLTLYCGAKYFLRKIALGNCRVFGENVVKNLGFKGGSPCPIVSRIANGQF
jgi:hypothetical protein